MTMQGEEVLSFAFNAVLHNYVKDAETCVFEEESVGVEFLLKKSESVNVMVFIWNDTLHAVKEENVQFCLEKSFMVILEFFCWLFRFFLCFFFFSVLDFFCWSICVLSTLKRSWEFLFYFKWIAANLGSANLWSLFLVSRFLPVKKSNDIFPKLDAPSMSKLRTI